MSNVTASSTNNKNLNSPACNCTSMAVHRHSPSQVVTTSPPSKLVVCNNTPVNSQVHNQGLSQGHSQGPPSGPQLYGHHNHGGLQPSQSPYRNYPPHPSTTQSPPSHIPHIPPLASSPYHHPLHSSPQNGPHNLHHITGPGGHHSHPSGPRSHPNIMRPHSTHGNHPMAPPPPHHQQGTGQYPYPVRRINGGTGPNSGPNSGPSSGHHPVRTNKRSQRQMGHDVFQDLPQNSYHMNGNMNQGLNGEWQSDRDMAHRRDMIQNIVHLLKKQDTNASQEWLNKLPQMVKQLEVSLYRSAPSFETYNDKSTLKLRLQKLAMEIAKKTSPGKERNDLLPPSQYLNINNYQSNSVLKRPNIPLSPNDRTHESRPSSHHHPSSNLTNVFNRTDPNPEHRGDPDWQLRIHHKQQRLLLLHHSSKCQAEEGSCRATPHCADMKRLWKHMTKCSNSDCRIDHCYSSRSILTHYRQCDDPKCPACGPVRMSVMKDVRRQKEKEAHNHQKCHSWTPPISGNNSHNMKYYSNPPPNDPPNSRPFSAPPYGSDYHHNTLPQRPPQENLPNHDPMSMNYNYDRPSSSNTPSHNEDPYRGSSSHYRQEHRRSNHDDMTEQEYQDRIRHKQQRLLLLRHASNCKVEDGTCQVSPHCAAMKQLWKHIINCHDENCSVPHCVSSRYVLGHFRKCLEANCPACGPVRERIRYEKQQQMYEVANNPNPVNDSIQTLSMSPNTMSVQINLDQGHSKKPRVKKQSSAESSFNSTPPLPPPTESLQPPQSTSTQLVKRESIPTPQESTSYSILTSFTPEQVTLHIQSLDGTHQVSRAMLKTKCSELLKTLQNHQHGWVFNNPVDPVELGLPDYFDIIKYPMDLGTIAKKLQHENYHDLNEFILDVSLTFYNAMTYNEDGSVVHSMANELKSLFSMDCTKLRESLQSEEAERRKNTRACHLCGYENIFFEPPVFFCHSTQCPTKRINRKRYYYVGGNGSQQYYWCNSCYNDLSEQNLLDVPDMKLKKANLTKKKNDEIHEESWVQCDGCNRWIHQICGLFNSRQNKDHGSKYNCPQCLYTIRTNGTSPRQTLTATAEALPRTKLSEWLERHVAQNIEKYYSILAKEKSEVERISLQKAEESVRGGGAITIRQVTSTDRKLDVRQRMKRRYSHKNYPEEFPFRCKCIVVFQNLDGIDVVLFALYVYEHGPDNPPPNTRAVYISYLDSVHFMRPRKLRTFVYHEILLAYLDYARLKGYATAHIWACPPLKGDDYIFYAKPEDQKIPKDSRLRQWYIDMLTEGQKRCIVGKVTNMHDLYFSNKELDATVVPYLEGDYFCGEAENIIKEIESGSVTSCGRKVKKKKNKSNKSKSSKMKDHEEEFSSSKNPPKIKRRSSTSSVTIEGDDISPPSLSVEEPVTTVVKASTSVDPIIDSITGRDALMVKMGETIHPMRESFIVAYLNWDGAKEEDLQVPKEILEFRATSPTPVTKYENIENLSPQPLKRDQRGNPIKIIDDDMEELDCEFLNNRQAFLNLCRGNHYQYDQLRRAKHTSMMILWHLHNRGAAKFVQQCHACSKEILSGIRYHCMTCSDYDLCQDCYKNRNTNRGLCTHTLVGKSVEVENSSTGSSSASTLTDTQRKERKRNIQLHIQLIEHASMCVSRDCTSANCMKMKEYLNHGNKCKHKVAGGCKICKRIWTLLRYHAHNCKNNNCTIPQCLAIRERIRLLANQQQAMDDRRRQEMNRHYAQVAV